jgi:hypothetical protein
MWHWLPNGWISNPLSKEYQVMITLLPLTGSFLRLAAGMLWLSLLRRRGCCRHY